MQGIPQDYVFGDISVSKVRTGGGTSGGGKAIPEAVLKMLQDRWKISVAETRPDNTYALLWGR